VHTKEAGDVKVGDRLWLADSMEMEVVEITPRGVTHPRTLEYVAFLEIHLDDDNDTDWTNSDLLKGKPDPTGSMSICKDPTAELEVLDVGEAAPAPYWHVD
jgi:hypothetical protein